MKVCPLVSSNLMQLCTTSSHHCSYNRPVNGIWFLSTKWNTLLIGSRSLMLELLNPQNNSLRLVPIIINNSWCNKAVFMMCTKRNKPTKFCNSTFGSLYRVDFLLCITPECFGELLCRLWQKWTWQNYKTTASCKLYPRTMVGCSSENKTFYFLQVYLYHVEALLYTGNNI